MTAPGPRIAPLPRGQWDDLLAKVLETSPGGTEEPMHIFATLARANPPNSDLFRRWIAFGASLLGGSLPGRLRELVILRTAHRFDGRYEWAQHLQIGEAQGVTRVEMAALGDGAAGGLDAAPWSPLERAALQAVDDTADLGAVSDETWAVLAAHMSEGELIELLMLVGHYLMLTTVLRSLRMELEPRAEALARSVPGGPAA
jgi:alkylhydroperoxidase family enzyme